MLLKISRYFLYASLLSVLFVNKSLFFPFISGKQIFFRFCVEGALAFFLAHVACALLSRHQKHAQETLAALKKNLKHPVVICLALFALAFCISTIFSPTPGVAFWSNFERGDGAFQIIHYVLFAILIKILFTGEKKIHSLLIANIIISIPVCFYAFGQMFSAPGSSVFIASTARVSGTLGNPSYLAAYLIFSLAFIVYFLIRTKDSLVKLGLIALGAAQIVLMIKAQTLGVALGVLIGLIVFAVHLTLTTKDKKIKKIGLITFGVVVAFTLLFFSTKQLPFWKQIPLFERITDISKAYEGVRPRLWTWQSAVAGIAARPIVGWGLENFAIPFDTYYNPLHYGGESFFDRTHDIFLEYFIGGGLLALIPWLLIFFFYYLQLKKRHNSIWKSVLIAVPIMYLVQGVFLFDVLPIYLTFLLFLVFVINTNPPEENNPPLPETLHDQSPLSYLMMGGIFALSGVLMYTTAYAPLRRNQLIVGALTDGGMLMQELNYGDGNRKITKSPVEIIKEFHTAIDYPSPVGQGEAIEMYHKFALDLLAALSQIPKINENEIAKQEVLAIVNDLTDTYEAHGRLVPGIKDDFTIGGTNVRVGLVFKLPELIARGRTMLEDALQRAPNRIEIITILLELAKATKDEQLLRQYEQKATALRPDLYPVQTSTVPSK